MEQIWIEHLEWAAQSAAVWGPVLIFLFMAIESSLVPFPSEVVMIPAGFLAARGDLPLGHPLGDAALAVACGVAGSIAGAFFNYYLAAWLGRPFLQRYGRYFFLPQDKLERAEEIFRRHGDITTFVCRLLPAIRQLISLPAGLARMRLGRFTFFTSLGAGLWVAILTWIGYALGARTRSLSYAEVVREGKNLLHVYYPYLLAGLVVVVLLYVVFEKLIMTKSRHPAPDPPAAP
jgi:membrane protein DedA with SNARE-associated domain